MKTNWTSILTGIGAALMSALTVLAALPYTLGELGEVIPPDWKPFVVKGGIAATIILRVINEVAASKKPDPQNNLPETKVL